MSIKGEKNLVTSLSQNYNILRTLYFKSSINQRMLSEEAHVDEGNLSTKITRLENLNLLKTYRIKIGKGNYHRIIELTPFSRSLLEQIINESKRKEGETTLVKKDIHHQLQSFRSAANKEDRRLALERIELITREAEPIQLQELQELLHEGMLRRENRRILLQILRNLVSVATGETLTEMSLYFRQAIDAILEENSEHELGDFSITLGLLPKINPRKHGYQKMIELIEKYSMAKSMYPDGYNGKINLLINEILRSYPEYRDHLEASLTMFMKEGKIQEAHRGNLQAQIRKMQ